MSQPEASTFPIIRYLSYLDGKGESTFKKDSALYIAIAVQSRPLTENMKYASEMQKGTLA